MKTKIFFIAVLALLLLNSAALAEDPPVKPLQVGDTVETYTLEDQHGEKHTLKDDTRHLLISGTMSVSKEMNTWLNEKDKNYLAQNSTEYISDITEMPALVTWLFAGPKMRKYPFEILLADDENFAPKYPLEEGKILMLDLDASKKVTGISYFENMDQIEKEKFSAAAEQATLNGSTQPGSPFRIRRLR